MTEAAKNLNPNIRSVAHEVWQQHPNDYETAKRVLEKRISSNGKLFAEACRIAAEHLIGQEAGRVRKNVVVPITPAAGDTQGLYAMARRNADALMDTPLGFSNGKRLGDATKPEVLREAERFRKLSETNGFTARFMEGIAAKMDKGKTVAKSLTERQLKTLRDSM
jgi:hypothetical protein